MTRKPLGRGLEALIENARLQPVRAQPASADSATMLTVPIERISPSPFQPRTSFDSERLDELARSIASQGLIEPLVVRPVRDRGDSYQLIAGERRLRAAREAGLTAVPVLVRHLDDRQTLEMSLVENLAREDLGPIDEARALLRLSRDFELSLEEIARRIGKSRPYASNAIRLLDLPASIIEMIERGQLTAGQARPLIALDGERSRIEAARRIVTGGMSARGAEAMVRAMRRTRASAEEQTLDANLRALTENLQKALKRRVRIIPARKGATGRVEIEYYDNHDLAALAESLALSQQT